MARIEIEDRTQSDGDAQRVVGVAQAIVATAIVASQGNPGIGLGGLALALGQGAARTGADLEEVIERVREAYAAGQAAIFPPPEGTN